jgi:CO/xanthine dehydrogenase Mo-binding subunit
VGEPVAAVVAESEAQAADARDLIEVDNEPLPGARVGSRCAKGPRRVRG